MASVSYFVCVCVCVCVWERESVWATVGESDGEQKKKVW